MSIMDPIFANDWLHDHNLDSLFDLFEEEMERKNNKIQPLANGSDTLLGTTPITSSFAFYSTSPSMASALDLYDWFYFENNNNNTYNNNNNISSNNNINTSFTCNASNNGNNFSNNLSSNNFNNISNQQNIANVNTSNNHTHSSIGSSPININNSSSHPITTNHIANSISNAMRIKKQFKNRRSEGISLLARPPVNNHTNDNSSKNHHNHHHPHHHHHNHLKNHSNLSSNLTSSSITNDNICRSNYIDHIQYEHAYASVMGH